MNKPELYHKTVTILVQAYFNDTLRHGKCTACAVGNIICVSTGDSFIINDKSELVWRNRYANVHYGWPTVFSTIKGEQLIHKQHYKGEAKYQIDSTGYTWQELAKIEFAFETAPKGNSDDEWMFNGLMAVVDVLDEIHQNTSKEVTDNTKQLFVKA